VCVSVCPCVCVWSWLYTAVSDETGLARAESDPTVARLSYDGLVPSSRVVYVVTTVRSRLILSRFVL